jgi:hypothetical protein
LSRAVSLSAVLTPASRGHASTNGGIFVALAHGQGYESD